MRYGVLAEASWRRDKQLKLIFDYLWAPGWIDNKSSRVRDFQNEIFGFDISNVISDIEVLFGRICLFTFLQGIRVILFLKLMIKEVHTTYTGLNLIFTMIIGNSYKVLIMHNKYETFKFSL